MAFRIESHLWPALSNVLWFSACWALANPPKELGLLWGGLALNEGARLKLGKPIQKARCSQL